MEAKIYDSVEMEEHAIYVKALRVLTVPLLNAIPGSILQKLIKKSSPYGAQVLEKPGSTHALETMYTKHENTAKRLITNFTDFFWHNFVSQPKAVRNRLRIVEDILEKEIVNSKKNEITIYNIGGGSSRAIIKTISKAMQKIDSEIKITTVDKDARALELGEKISTKFGVQANFKWLNGDVRDLGRIFEEDSADIIEMVGLLDYFDCSASITLISTIFKLLKPGGLFIVANVHPNVESSFVQNVGWPKMYYKTSKELNEILVASGFSNDSTALFIEPLKVHLVGLARK